MPKRSFDRKTVIVTGAARGLGKALCRRFAVAGARIGGIDLRAEELAATREQLRAEGSVMESAVCDLTGEAATAAAFGELRARLGPADVVIANAGVTHVEPFGAGGVAAVRRVVEVNFFGAVHAAAAAFDDVVERRGLFIAVSSVAGYAPLVGRIGYCAGKHALEGFFATLRNELRGSGAGVLIVRPSFIATDLVDPVGERRSFGAQAQPQAVADKIFTAARRGRRHLATGHVGHLAFWVHRFAPRIYEALMRRSMG